MAPAMSRLTPIPAESRLSEGCVDAEGHGEFEVADGQMAGPRDGEVGCGVTHGVLATDLARRQAALAPDEQMDIVE